ncbi:hypothetical protein DR871_007390 [Flavobacterium petrolei]|uniref:Transporter n=1 Tax=Flavobacterium petrolei TaxID=2259594 RepID=A0A482TKP3_9FLAO|nr:hypothetical protein [Flavobacterium petrolei]RYJ52058.1 hypothetical protein DR871_007390 [Flavobacterium petrolei]
MKKLLLIIAFGMFSNSYAQGCSDAGICSIGNSFQTTDKESKNGIEAGAIFGTGEADVTYISPYLTYTRTINERLSLSSKITYSVASGSFGQRGAFGDAFLIGNYNWKPKSHTQWSSLLGLKIPFTSSNLKINEFSLPLDYQSSLGTFDLIAGLNLNYKKWDFNTAVQIPVFNNNKNSYFREFSNTDDFPSTNLFERKSDALFRTTYTFQTTTKKFTFKPNVLFIYHLGEDSFENAFGQRETIKNSDGLTINGNIIGAYTINTKNSIELSLATPFLVREVRPDGLTRGFTAGIIYKVSF